MLKTDRRTSADNFWGWHTIITDGSKYMTRVWFGRLRVHVFYRGDADQDPHDHPWDFWTFPLTSYVEEITTKIGEEKVYTGHGDYRIDEEFKTERHVVRAFWPSFRPATHTHRVMGRYSHNVWSHASQSILKHIGPGMANDMVAGRLGEPYYDGRKIVTIVWRSEFKRKWGFLKHKDGRWCWQAWRDYALHGGKNAPCE